MPERRISNRELSYMVRKRLADKGLFPEKISSQATLPKMTLINIEKVIKGAHKEIRAILASGNIYQCNDLGTFYTKIRMLNGNARKKSFLPFTKVVHYDPSPRLKKEVKATR